jgi:CBS domain-containing protein
MLKQTDFLTLIEEKEPFHLLTSQQLKRITEGAVIENYTKKQFLFHEQDKEVEISFLLSGITKNILHKSNGKQVSVRYYYPGDIIGLMIMFTSGDMNFSVQAIEDSQVIRLKKSTFLEMMSENKKFSEVILESIGERMKTLYDEIKAERDREDDQENIPLFRTRVASIMEQIKWISPSQTLLEAAHEIQSSRFPGFIVSEDGFSLLGVITHHEVIDGFIQGKSSDSVKDWMKQQPYTVEFDNFSYEALTFFKHHEVSLVPVMRKNKLVGMVTAESFLHLQDSEYLSLSYQLQAVQEIERLTDLSPTSNDNFQAFVRELLDNGTLSYEICEIISNYNDKIHRQIIKIAERKMKVEGYGPPPVNYCFIVMGSEGRKEQAFSTDQDNGLIIDDYEHLNNAKEIKAYFKRFSEIVNHALAFCGFPECKGGIMAKEEKWARTIRSWEEEIQRWMKESDAEEIRNFTIFMDFRPIYGDFQLAQALRSILTERVKRAQTLHHLLIKDTIRFRIPLNAFGRLNVQGKKKQLNLKKSAIMQIVNGVRIFAIKYGIDEVNTLKRLRVLKEKEIFHPRDVQNIETALHYLLRFRLQNNLKQLQNNEPLTNHIVVPNLLKEEKRQLKEALAVAKRMQQVSELSFGRNRGL